MRLTSDQTAAVRRLMDNSDFTRFMTGISEYHEILIQQLTSCPTDQLQVAQGRAQAILRVITAVSDAKKSHPLYRS